MVFLEKRVSEKTKKEYTALYISVNGKDYLVSYDKLLILEIFNLSPSQIMELPVGEKYMLFEDKKKVGDK